MKSKVLVIGSRDHSRASCVDWLQPFPNIEEYDTVIIHMQSLTQEVYDKVKTKIYGMKEMITAVFNSNREIFCIMNKLMIPSPPPRRPGETHFKGITPGYVSPTNYDWLPTRIEINDRKRGSSINLFNHRFGRYFECIDKWDLTISLSSENLAEIITAFMYKINPIATNKSQKTIAGSLIRIQALTDKPLKGYGSVHLLPPTTKCDIYQAIEILLDLVCGEEVEIVPPWRKSIQVPEIKGLKKQVENKITDVKKIQQEISQLRIRMQEWDSYRDLLTATGDRLENIVQKALADIGIKTKKTQKGFPADLISKEVAVEITGIKGCVGVSSEKVIQTSRFKQNYHKGEKIILIANTHMDLSPKDRKRKMNFSPPVIKYFESLPVCCLTTITLFQLWKDVITKKKDPEDVKSKILTKEGELTLGGFE